MKTKCLSIILFTALCVFSVSAQTTEFTYQGVLNSGATPANGNYDFEFLLFDALAGGTQLGSAVARPAIVIADGRFAVNLDFGNRYNGADIYLEIRVRPAGTGGYTILDPRQRVRSAPYSVRSLNAATSDAATNALNLGGVAAGQFVQTGDARLSDARSPLPGSSNYIQNQFAAPQPSTSFNISGNGLLGGGLSASYVNAGTDYRLGTSTILHGNGDDNWAVGFGAGQSITSGVQSVYFGRDAGWLTTIGNNNTFVGYHAGRVNTTGSFNTYVGWKAGVANTGGFSNTVLGTESGTGITTAFGNTIVGAGAGNNLTTGSENVLIGRKAEVGASNLFNANAIGSYAFVTQSSSLVLGAIAGVNGANFNTNVGIGTTAPKARLHVVGGSIFIAQPNSLIITAPNGTCWFITVSNTGTLSTISVTCP